MRLGLAKALGAAGVLITTALVGGTLIGSALAVEDPADDDAGLGADRAYCETFMDTLAAELGTTREGLVAAGQVAASAAIDAAVAAGDLTEERAAEMRERIAEFDGEGCRWFGPGAGGHPGREHGRDADHGPGAHGPGGLVRGFIGANALDAAAEAIGIDESALRTELRESGSLQAVAEANGVAYEDVSAAALAAVQADLDAAVAEGNLEQERADSILERVRTWLDDGGAVRGPQHHGDDADADAEAEDDAA